MKSLSREISMIRGDDKVIKVTLRSGDKTPIPFVFGETIYFTVKRSVALEEKEIQKIITTFEEGTAIVELTPEDTAHLDFREYVYDIQWVNILGKKKTLVVSKFTIKAEVTRE